MKEKYILKIDENATTDKKYYIRGAFPSCYLTDNMTYKQAQLVIKSFSQLGHTIVEEK